MLGPFSSPNSAQRTRGQPQGYSAKRAGQAHVLGPAVPGASRPILNGATPCGTRV